MFYVICGLVFIIMSCIVGWFVYQTSKQIGELEAMMEAKEEERKQYEKDKEIVLANSNLELNRLVDKLHDIQNKSK